MVVSEQIHDPAALPSLPNGRSQRGGQDTVIHAATRSETPVVQPVAGNGVINTAIEGFRCNVDESSSHHNRQSIILSGINLVHRG
jgi:hypothetical protein